MCTVSYLPQKDGFILTSNRDEHIRRPAALPICQYAINGQLLYFPKDPKAGGTWIATDGVNRTVCLLNGGTGPHEVQPNYRKSRGLVVLDYFQFANVETFAKAYDFQDIEPFTLIVVEEGNAVVLRVLRWDATTLHVAQPDARQPQIWSSVTLYEAAVRMQREYLFADWVEAHPEPSQEAIMDFHRWGSLGDKTIDLVMQHEQKRTVSICSFAYDKGAVQMRYFDLIADECSKHLIYQ